MTWRLAGLIAGAWALAGQGLAAPSAAPPSRGRVLAEQGAWAIQVPPCAGCHGPTGMGVNGVTPPLAGQSAANLLTQLQRFRDGGRPGDPLGLMAGVAKRLSSEDIKAAANYYAGLSVSGPRP